ncbi:hypothetical protein ACFV8E_37960 [Streptomyces sp. NPDC059849]|uniref:hypothetical protein n=1 Tax=Streptomyces sp. NPDC059849 TaxID=3346969 RepID=UPI003664BD47
MTGAARTARRTPARPAPVGTSAQAPARTARPGTAPARTAPPGTAPARTAPPGTAPARAAAHPVPKSFRSKERPS